jgi:hypothetical protein
LGKPLEKTVLVGAISRVEPDERQGRGGSNKVDYVKKIDVWTLSVNFQNTSEPSLEQFPLKPNQYESKPHLADLSSTLKTEPL